MCVQVDLCNDAGLLPLHERFISTKEVHIFKILFCFLFGKLHHTDVSFDLGSFRCNTVLGSVVVTKILEGYVICFKNIEKTDGKGSEIGFVYHFTVIMPSHSSVSHKERCLVMWAFIYLSLFLAMATYIFRHQE